MAEEAKNAVPCFLNPDARGCDTRSRRPTKYDREKIKTMLVHCVGLAPTSLEKLSLTQMCRVLKTHFDAIGLHSAVCQFYRNTGAELPGLGVTFEEVKRMSPDQILLNATLTRRLFPVPLIMDRSEQERFPTHLTLEAAVEILADDVAKKNMRSLMESLSPVLKTTAPCSQTERVALSGLVLFPDVADWETSFKRCQRDDDDSEWRRFATLAKSFREHIDKELITR